MEKSQVEEIASNVIGTVADDLATHVANTGNPHSVTKAQVGLSNVDNTSDANKPVSTAQATAIALKLAIANNLSDLNSAATARTNLGLGTLATQNGTFSGTSSGTNTGDQTTVSGNAGTATALETARTINGVSFNGTANITVTCAADTLTGTTLNSSVVTSSLTSVGTITTGTWSGTTIAVSKGGTGLTAGTSGGVLYYSASGTLASSGALTASALILGGGAGATPTSLALGTANQIVGMNNAGTANEYKTVSVSSTAVSNDVGVTLTGANALVINVPDASATVRGVVTTGTQSYAGSKTWSTGMKVSITGTASTPVNGFTFEAGTSATAGTTVQMSPRARFNASVWNTSAAVASDWTIENLPTSAATPTSVLRFSYSAAGGAYAIKMLLDNSGRMFIGGSTAPTAVLHLAAGTATASTAPLKFTAGTLLSTPEIGAMEFVDDGTTGHLYITVKVATVTTRVQIV